MRFIQAAECTSIPVSGLRQSLHTLLHAAAHRL